jgi:hypothetical protein
VISFRVYLSTATSRADRIHRYMRDIEIKASSNTTGTIHELSNALPTFVPVDPLHKIRKLSGSLQQVMYSAPPAVVERYKLFLSQLNREYRESNTV